MRYIDESIQERINAKKKRLDSIYIDYEKRKQLERESMIHFIQTSNAIEGSPIPLEETRGIIVEGKNYLNRSNEYCQMVRNHVGAFNYVNKINQTNAALSVEIILGFHRILLHKIDKNAGTFRDNTNAYSRIHRQIVDIIQWKKDKRESYTAIEDATIFQAQFHRIRPFNYGNGTISRLMTKLILSKENIPFCLQLTETELKYYRKAVEKACKGNLSPFVNLVAVCVERSIDNYLNNVGYIDVVTLEEAMQDYNYTKEYLAYLVRKDRLRAYKKDNKVFIMKKDLESIVQSDICVELVTQK